MPAEPRSSDLGAAEIAKAVAHDELVLHYQPVVNVHGGGVECYEALVRWDRPGAGIRPPGEFIPVAEASDLICDVDAWALDEAARQLAAWNRTSGDRGLRMAVNVSGRSINSARVRDAVDAALDSHDVDPGQLVLEITETVLVDDGLPVETLHELRHRGVALSLDDCGTGYSSVAQLSRLPVDIVKLDRDYLDGSTPSARHRLQAMVHASHALGLAVVGEGVEREDQLVLLRELGVEFAQGFLLGRPMTPAELELRGQDPFA